MDEKQLINELTALLSKISTWVFSIFIGVMAKISHDLMLKKKRPVWQWVGIIGMSVFGGYLMATYCATNNMENQGRWLVPMVTLFSEKIFLYITANWNKIVSVLLNRKE